MASYDAMMPERARSTQHLLDAGLVGILFWTIEGGITDANDTLLDMLGYSRADLEAGRIDWIEMTPADIRDRDRQPVAELYRTGRHLPFEKEYLRKDGSRIPVLVASAFNEGSRTEGVGFVVDITAQKRAERQARDRSAEIIAIFESMTDAFFAVDNDWKFTYVNSQAERLMQRKRDDLLGNVLWDEFPATSDSIFGREYRRALAENVSVRFEAYYPPLDGWFEVQALPGSGGIGLSVYFREVSARRAAEQEREAALGTIQETQERLQLALASGKMGTWDADLVAGTLTLSPEIPPLYGRPATEQTILLDEWIDWLHPDERERIPSAFAAALRDENEYDVRFRTLWPDGISFRWVATRALITRDAAGNAIRAVGYTRDVTEETEREAERDALLTRQRQFMRDMVFSLTEGKFRLCLSETELPPPGIAATEIVDLTIPSLRVLRKKLNAVTEEMRFAKERAQDIETAVGEASMNAVTHGGGGTGWVAVDPDRGVVQIWVRDSGAGISEEALPHVLEKGISSIGTLGHGFWLMMQTCDRIFLFSSPKGTTVVLEQEREPREPTWLQSFA